MNCEQCSAELVGAGKFCASCGKPVNPSDARPAPESWATILRPVWLYPLINFFFFGYVAWAVDGETDDILLLNLIGLVFGLLLSFVSVALAARRRRRILKSG